MEMWSAPHRHLRRSRSTSRRLERTVLFGDRCGRLERAASPAKTSAAKRLHHLRTVLASIWNRTAVASTDQPLSKTQAHMYSRGRGLSRALGCRLLA